MGASGTGSRRAPARTRSGRPLVVIAVLLAVLLPVGRGAVEDVQRRFRSTRPGATPYVDVFRAAADRFPAVTAAQLAAQARAESDFDPDAVSAAGAQGMMQVIPATFARFGVDGDRDGVEDPFDPDDSVFTAAAYLTWLGRRLHLPVSDERVVAAYNAGPDAVRRAGGVPDYPETLAYVDRVRGWVGDYGWLDA